MSILIGAIPFLTEGAVAVGTTVGEAVGSEAVGTAVSGTILSKTGELLDSTVAQGVDTVFGPNAYENFTKGVNSNFQDAKTIGMLHTGDFDEKFIVNTIRKMKKNHNDIAQDVSNFTKDVATQSLGDTVPNVLEKIKRTNPVYYYLASKMLDITHDIVLPTDEDYKRVASVYDGSVFFNNDVKSRQTMNGVEFYGLTEKGPVVWKYPEYNDYTVISPIWGTWTGINSPNNTVPVYGNYQGRPQQSQLDKIAFIHDCLYHDYGSFNKFADSVLISYIDNGINKGIFVFPNELETAKVARTYFSTLGTVVRKIYGDDVSKGIINDLYKTIYNVELSGEHIGELRGLFVEAQALDKPAGTTGSTSPDEQELLTLINTLVVEVDY